MSKKSVRSGSWQQADTGQQIGSSMRAWWHAVGMGSEWRPSESELQCSAQTVRRRLHRFDAEGIEGLGDRPRSGRPRRLTETERSKLIALASLAPPGHVERQADGTMMARDEEGSGKFRLNALAQAAKAAGIRVKRSQIRTILLREGVGFRRTHSWGTSSDEDFVGSRPAVVSHYTQPPEGSTTMCTDETLASSSPHLCACSGLVPHRTPHQSAPGLQPRT